MHFKVDLTNGKTSKWLRDTLQRIETNLKNLQHKKDHDLQLRKFLHIPVMFSFFFFSFFYFASLESRLCKRVLLLRRFYQHRDFVSRWRYQSQYKIAKSCLSINVHTCDKWYDKWIYEGQNPGLDNIILNVAFTCMNNSTK